MLCFAGMATCRDEKKDHYLRKSAELPVPGKGKRGRPTKRWKDSVKKAMELRWAEGGTLERPEHSRLTL